MDGGSLGSLGFISFILTSLTRIDKSIKKNMAHVSIALKIALGFLMVVSIIELGFVTATVAWLHSTASKGFQFRYQGSTHKLAGEPSNFLVDQGHTSNGAAGTAFVLIGLGGIVALWIQGRTYYRSGSRSRYLYYIWLALQIPALLLTAGALAYVFYVTTARNGQTIDMSLAAKLNGSPYSLQSWTPQNWFGAVLQLDLINQRSDIEIHLYIMKGWQYNLVPFLFIQLVETIFAFMDYFAWKREGKMTGHSRV